MKATILSDERRVARMKAMITEEFSHNSFLRSAKTGALAARLQSKLTGLLLTGEPPAEIIDGLIALGHAFDFNDQQIGDKPSDWCAELWVSDNLRIEYRLDYDSARRSGIPSGVELDVTWR